MYSGPIGMLSGSWQYHSRKPHLTQTYASRVPQLCPCRSGCDTCLPPKKRPRLTTSGRAVNAIGAINVELPRRSTAYSRGMARMNFMPLHFAHGCAGLRGGGIGTRPSVVAHSVQTLGNED